MERDRVLASGCSATAGLGWASWVNTGWLHDWVGVFGGVENPEAAKRFKTRWSYGAIGTRHRSNQRSAPTAAVTQHSQLHFPRTVSRPFAGHGDAFNGRGSDVPTPADMLQN